MNGFGNWTYRRLAAMAAWSLARSGGIRGVYARRSVASGEVSFGRSDIDLALVLESQPDAADLAARLLRLYRRFRRLRIALPVLGECLVHDDWSLAIQAQVDPYRSSIDRRVALPLFGPAPTIPAAPIRPRDAAFRGIFWLESYLPRAFRRHNRRDLWKLVLEIWNAWATASGMLREPLLTRAAIDTAIQESGDSECLSARHGSSRALLAVWLRLAARLHAACLSPLRPLRQPLVTSVLLPPLDTARRLVLIPGPDSDVPAAAATRGALVATPEALALYVAFVNPYFHPRLPEPAQELGIVAPGWQQCVLACGHLATPHRFRSAGFLQRNAADLPARLHLLQATLTAAREGRAPLLPAASQPAAHLDAVRYYRERFAETEEQLHPLWAEALRWWSSASA